MNVTFEFPEIIHINILDAETRLPIQNIALLIHLLALRNMDHFLLSPVSDIQGNVNISKRWLNEQIDTNAVYLPVDRISGIDDLYPAIEVMTATEHDIDKSIELLSNNQSYGENIAQIEELSNSVNHLYSQSNISLELNNEPEIWVTLEITKTKLVP
jgi:hypothetical protein